MRYHFTAAISITEKADDNKYLKGFLRGKNLRATSKTLNKSEGISVQKEIN
jgi:hypothetical protein